MSGELSSLVLERMRIVESRLGRKVAPVPGNRYEKGKLYYCGYWKMMHRIVDINEDRFAKYISQWDDGHITEHCTEPNPQYDFLILE